MSKKTYFDTALGTTIEVLANTDLAGASTLTGWRELAHTLLADIHAMADLRASNHYTPAGLRAALDQRLAEARQRLAPLQDQVTVGRKRLADIEARTAAPPARTTDLAALLEEREIRDRLQGRDLLEVDVLAFEAQSRGDMAFVRAVEQAPQAFPLLSESGRATLRQMRLAASPEKADYDQVFADVTTLQSLIGAATKDLQDAAEVHTGEAAFVQAVR